MSGNAQPWSVKGIDPKAREAAREQARRQGMTLGEWLNQTILTNGLDAGGPPGAVGGEGASDPGDDGWLLTPPARPVGSDEATGLAKRIDAAERKTQLAVAGLDRALTTLDRSLIGLSVRIDEAEAVSERSRQDMSLAAQELAQTREQAAAAEAAAREAAQNAQALQNQVSARIEDAAAKAHEQALRATIPVLNELKSAQASLAKRLAEAESGARSLSEAALGEVKRLQEHVAAGLGAAERAARQNLDAALAEMRAAQTALATKIAETEAAGDRRETAALEEMQRIQGLLDARLQAAEQAARAQANGALSALQEEQARLLQRVEAAEAGAAAAATTLRQAAGAAIADLRNAQLGLQARVKTVEDAARENGAGAQDMAALKAEQADLRTQVGALEGTLQRIDAGMRAGQDQSGEAVRSLDDSLQRLAERLARAEETANSAMRSLEDRLAALHGEAGAGREAREEAAALRDMVETRLDSIARHVAQSVEAARDDLSGQLRDAVQGIDGDAMSSAIADVNRRLAATERRQAQTIEAISAEIERLSDTMDRRLRAVEERNDDASGALIREEIGRFSRSIEARFSDAERREAAALDRMGDEIGKLSERLEDRFATAEHRSAQALEQVGEHVARMAERFNARQEQLAQDLTRSLVESEERSASRLGDAVSVIGQRLSEIDGRSAEAVTPVQKALASFAARLQALEDGAAGPGDLVFGAEPPAPAFAPPPPQRDPVRAGPISPPLAQTPSTPTPFLAPEPRFSEADDWTVEDDGSHAFDGSDAAASNPFEAALEAQMREASDPASATQAPPPFDDSPLFEPAAPQAEGLAPPGRTNAKRSPPALSPGDEDGLDPAVPAREEDYIAAARRAALANAPGAKTKQDKPRKVKSPRNEEGSLRGGSRIVFWGAAGAIAVALSGAAYYVSERSSAASPDGRTGDDGAERAMAPAADAAREPAQASLPPSAEGGPAQPLQTQERGSPAPAAGAAPAQAAAGGEASSVERARPVSPTRPSLEEAAEAGNAVAQYDLALQQLAAGQTGRAIANLRAAADQGLAMAQYRLAKLFERGEGVPVDLAQARQWTERAASAGNRRAMHDLGVFFARGEGAPQDEAAAFRWFRQAAELGVTDSQFNLGVMYQQGRGAPQNLGEALFWFLVAANGGDADALARSQTLEGQVSDAAAQQARARASAFRPRAASARANGDLGPRPWEA